MMIKMLTAGLMVMLKAVMKRIAKTVITFTTALYSTSQFISIMFPCSFFFFLPNKELSFSSVGEPLHDHGHVFA